jgi:hypothetical protein
LERVVMAGALALILVAAHEALLWVTGRDHLL